MQGFKSLAYAICHVSVYAIGRIIMNPDTPACVFQFMFITITDCLYLLPNDWSLSHLRQVSGFLQVHVLGFLHQKN